MDTLLDARVNVLVEYDCVVPLEKCAEEREIREEAAAEKKRLLVFEKLRREFFQPRMCGMIASQEARTARSDCAVFLYRFHHGLAQRGMPRQTEVIVRGEIDAPGGRELAKPMLALQPLHLRRDSRQIGAQFRPVFG